MTDQFPPSGSPTPPPWPPQQPASPQYPSGPPTQYPAHPPLPTPPTSSAGAPKPKRAGLFIALGAMVLAVAIVIVALALPDSTSPTIGLPAAPNVTLLTPTTVTVTDAAADDVTIEGDSLMELGDPLGATVPTITGNSFDGSEVVIDGTEATVVVVMAHWCPHCQAEIPRIVEAYAAGKLPAGVRVVGLATANDEARGNFPPAKWLAEEGWPFAVMIDDEDSSAMMALGALGFPSMIAFDANGTITAHESGEKTLEELQSIWNSALGASSD